MGLLLSRSLRHGSRRAANRARARFAREDALDELRLFDTRDDLQLPAAAPARLDLDREYALEPLCPPHRDVFRHGPLGGLLGVPCATATAGRVIAARRAWCAANTPWYLVVCMRGGGTSAARRAAGASWKTPGCGSKCAQQSGGRKAILPAKQRPDCAGRRRQSLHERYRISDFELQAGQTISLHGILEGGAAQDGQAGRTDASPIKGLRSSYPFARAAMRRFISARSPMLLGRWNDESITNSHSSFHRDRNGTLRPACQNFIPSFIRAR